MSDKEHPELPDPNLVASVGAIVFASGDPVDPREVVDALEGVDPESVERLFDALEQEYRWVLDVLGEAGIPSPGQSA